MTSNPPDSDETPIADSEPTPTPIGRPSQPPLGMSADDADKLAEKFRPSWESMDFTDDGEDLLPPPTEHSVVSGTADTVLAETPGPLALNVDIRNAKTGKRNRKVKRRDEKLGKQQHVAVQAAAPAPTPAPQPVVAPVIAPAPSTPAPIARAPQGDPWTPPRAARTELGGSSQSGELKLPERNHRGLIIGAVLLALGLGGVYLAFSGNSTASVTSHTPARTEAPAPRHVEPEVAAAPARVEAPSPPPVVEYAIDPGPIEQPVEAPPIDTAAVDPTLTATPVEATPVPAEPPPPVVAQAVAPPEPATPPPVVQPREERRPVVASRDPAPRPRPRTEPVRTQPRDTTTRVTTPRPPRGGFVTDNPY